MSSAGTLVYPEFDDLARVAMNKEEVILPSKLSDWDFHYGDFEFVGAVTVSMDKISFLKPVLVGNVLFLNARINYAQKSSMEIEVQVEAEDIPKGTRVLTGTAFVTFVALDKNGKPVKIPKLVVKSKEDKKIFEQGKLRMERRIKERRT